MFDILKLKLSTKFMKSIVSKLVSKAVYKKLGYKINIQFNDIQLDAVDGEVKFHIDVDGKMNNTEFTRLIEEIGKD